jgi:hypothetical protein
MDNVVQQASTWKILNSDSLYLQLSGLPDGVNVLLATSLAAPLPTAQCLVRFAFYKEGSDGEKLQTYSKTVQRTVLFIDGVRYCRPALTIPSS